MAKPSTYRNVPYVLGELRRLERRRHRVAMGTAVCITATVAMGLVVALTLAVGYGASQPSGALRWGLRIAATAVLDATLVWGPLRALFCRYNLAQTARYAEAQLAGLDNNLINAVLLADDKSAAGPLTAAAIDEAAATCRSIDLAAAVPTAPMRRAGRLAVAMVLVTGALCLLQWPHVTRAIAAVGRSEGYVPTVGSVEVVSVSPGDATIASGEAVTVEVTIRNDDGRDFDAQVVLGDADPATMMASADRRTYSLAAGKVHHTLRYHIRIGDTRLPADRAAYVITVQDPPAIAGLDATLTPPAYTGRPTERQTDIAGDIEALVGTRIDLTIRTDRPVGGALLTFGGEAPRPMSGDDTGRAFTAGFEVVTDADFAALLTDDADRVLARAPDNGETYAIRAVADEAPSVIFARPGPATTAVPGGSVDLTVLARDDHGLTGAEIRLGVKGQADTVVRQFDLAGVKADLTHTLDIPRDTPAGTVLVCSAAVTDNRRWADLTPQTSVRQLEILVQNPSADDKDLRDQGTQLRRAIDRLLRLQIKARLSATTARKRPTDPATQAMADQQRVLTETGRILGECDFAASPDVQTVLIDLAAEPMPAAIALAHAMAEADEPGERASRADLLIDTQEQIIEQLELLLACLAATADDVVRAAEDPAAEDLESDFAEMLRDLGEGLTRLADEYARLVPAADRLAKKPVDQFSDDDQELLHELRVAEDKWEKFLNEAFADFSKLAQQDFSNPSLLAEVLSIKTDVTMAKDALSAKAVEIATATDAMIAAGENAEQLTANLEKWLPDKPDRQKWAMEDPGAAGNIETPELPSELEDLIGDLLEQEEDLFEQMQDVTSQAAGSFDKGVGWAAMDGPISSMNAQGVTGNMLPNSSEISGRAGEGRQGKTSGEFVQDSFVGKGGRRTPTRLTGEPFSAGQVKDTSNEPPGGATGGGKIGGAAGEGLEGPVPPPLREQLDRLAARQAHLVNTAERLRPHFAGGYGGFQYERAVILMNRVGEDLKRYRYRNALRRQASLLEAMGQAQAAITDPIEYLRDQTSPQTKEIRRDIDQASRSALPEQYRAVLQSYLHKLTGQR